MNDRQPHLTQISIQEIVQIRAMLGSEEQVESAKLTNALDNLDTIILAFTNDLNHNIAKGN